MIKFTVIHARSSFRVQHFLTALDKSCWVNASFDEHLDTDSALDELENIQKRHPNVAFRIYKLTTIEEFYNG